MLYAYTKNNLLCGPLEIDNQSFNEMTDAERLELDFLPCEEIHSHRLKVGQQYVVNGLTRRNDTAQAHFMATDNTALIERSNSLLAIVASIELSINTAIQTYGISAGLESVEQDMIGACEDYKEMMFCAWIVGENGEYILLSHEESIALIDDIPGVCPECDLPVEEVG